VVALEVVLDGDLPVRGQLGLDALAEDERVRLDQRRKRAHRIGERRRVEVGVDEHERPPRIDLDGPEPELNQSQGSVVPRAVELIPAPGAGTAGASAHW